MTKSKHPARDHPLPSDSDSDDDILHFDVGFSQASTSSAQFGDDSPDGKTPSLKSPTSVDAGGRGGALEVEEEEEEVIEKEATRKAKISIVPTNVTSPSQLYFQRTTTKKVTKYHPCREGQKDEAVGLALPQEWDESTKALVQYVEFPRRMGELRVVPRSSLIPFFGENDVSGNDGGSGNGSGSAGGNDDAPWCPDLCSRYAEQLKRDRRDRANDVEVRAHILFLGRILDSARSAEKNKAAGQGRRKGWVRKREKNGNHDDSASLSVHENVDVKSVCELDGEGGDPPVADEVDSDDDDNDEVGAGVAHLGDGRKTERINPGDVVEYYTHVYVAGDKRGYREATVLSVDPRREPVLALDNGEVLPRDTQVKRIKIKQRGALKEHNGVYRAIEDFKLRTQVPEGGGGGVAAGIKKESKRVGDIIQRKTAEFKARVNADGFGPIDLLNNFGGTRPETQGQQNGKNTAITVPLTQKQDDKGADSEPTAAQHRKETRRQHLEVKSNEEYCSSGRKRKRRGGPEHTMTANQLRLASRVEDMIEKKWGRIGFEEALDRLEGEVGGGGIPRYRLQKFLESDENGLVRERQHEETERALNEWLENIGGGQIWG